MGKIRIGGLLLVCLCVFSARMASAQVSTGTISGTVKDSSGAVLPGTKIVVQNQDTGISRTVDADENGHFTLPSLNPGSYRITARETVFKPKFERDSYFPSRKSRWWTFP